MKKTLAIILVLVFVLSLAGTALAAPASPFVDLPKGHWSYAAVDKLAQAGIVDGYGDGTFRGDRTMTRFEMAQAVARAMARSDKADAEQKALIDKLAVEFAAELNNLGVRVSKLEDKTKISMNYDSRIRYSDTKYDGRNFPFYGEGSNKFDWRQRIIFTGDVNDNVSYVARLGTNSNNPFFNNSANVTFGDAGNQTVGLDLAYFNIKNFLGADCLILGRLDTRGVTNGLLNGKDSNNDGVKVTKKFGDVTFNGIFTDQGTNTEVALYNFDFKPADNLKINVGYQAVNLTNSIWPMSSEPSIDLTAKSSDIGVQCKLGGVYLTGEYVNSRLSAATVGEETMTAYAFQITNGVSGYLYPTYNLVDANKAHSDAFALSYRKVNLFATPLMSTFGNDYYAGQFLPLDAATKGFFFTYQNVLSKDVVWTAEYQDLKFIEELPLPVKIFSTSVQFFF